MITTDDIRYAMLDYPDENDYLLEEEFTDETLEKARERAIDDWNARAPDHRQKTEQGFPEKYKGAWIDGAAGHAMRMKGMALKRNDVPGGAGGVEFRDKARADTYLQLGTQMVQEWRAMISHYLNIRGIEEGIISI